MMNEKGTVRVFETGRETPIHTYTLKEGEEPPCGAIIRIPNRGPYKIVSRIFKMSGALNLYVE